ncbi:hypothetical protein AB0C22_02425 [Micromonospora sp. NPDC048894]|uniref:hypothetical protein n=2 Tax=unclassified Micromonospora TaxID=2617518 RepID=UPI0033FCEB8F
MKTAMTSYRRAAGGFAALMIGCAVALTAPTSALAEVIDPDQPYNGIEGNFTGGDVTDPSIEQPTDTQTSLKIQLSQEYYAVNFQGADPTQLNMLEADYVAQYGDSGYVDPGDGAGLRTTAASSRILGLSQTGQSKGYYCGPASGYMILRYLHGTGFKSKYNGASLSQPNLATSSHMATEANGATTWTSKRFATGINRWRGFNWYVQVPKPSGSLLVAVFAHSIGGNGMPIGADTVEFAGGSHYNGHPTNKTIGHWIVGFGYTASGQTSSWADPATTVWSATKPSFSYSTSSFATRFLQSNGIVY